MGLVSLTPEKGMLGHHDPTGAAKIGRIFKKAGTPPSPSPAQRDRPPHGSNQGAGSRSRRTSRTSTGGPCLGARGKQAQLAQAKGSKLNLLLMLVAQMSTYPRVIATRYCSWGSRNFKLTHGALTAFEDLGVVAVAVPRRARRCFSARLRRPPTRHRNCGRLLLQNLRSFDQPGGCSRVLAYWGY